MEVKTQGKFIRISHLKARSIANEVRGKKAKESLLTLKMMPHKAAGIIAKVIKTAVADAEHNFSLDGKELTISTITVDKGPSFKRSQPAARGTAHPIEKRTSHITVVVSGETKIQKVKKADVVVEEAKEIKEEVSKKEGFNPKSDSRVSKSLEKGNQKGFFRRKTG